MHKNFFAALVPEAELRIQPLKRIALGIDASYLYDISNTNWKTRKKSNDYFLGYSKFSGSQFRIFIGWSFM